MQLLSVNAFQLALSSHQKKIISSIIPGKYLRYLYALKKTNAITLEELELIYVPIPKAANRSVKTALAEKTKKQYKISAHKANWDLIPIAKITSSPFFSFSVVRNPLDRLLSCYIQKSKMRNFQNNFWKYGKQVYPEMSFAAFANFVCNTPDHLADRHFKSQHLFLQREEKIVVDFVAKVESLNKDWEKLTEQFALPDLPHLNQSGKKPFADFYTKEIATMVKERYKKDIDLFGYSDEVNSMINRLER